MLRLTETDQGDLVGEFRKVLLSKLGADLSNEEKIVALMDKFDVAMDGLIDYAAFCRFASPMGVSDGTIMNGSGSIVDSNAFSKRLQRKVRELALYTNVPI